MASDLEESITNFWNLVDQFPKSFVEKFLTKVREAAWSIDDDPSCEVPRNRMYMLLEDEKKNIADVKPWTPLEESIKDMWKNFDTQDNKDLKLFCNLLKDDERFPKEFISGYMTLLDEKKWDVKLDVEFKMAKAIMTSHFKKFKTKVKKNIRKREHNKRERIAAEEKRIEVEKRIAEEEKRIEVEKRTAEEEKRIEDEKQAVVLTEEQVAENISLRRKNFEKQQKVLGKIYSEQQATKREAFNVYTVLKAEATHNNHLRDAFKNCKQFKMSDGAEKEGKD